MDAELAEIRDFLAAHAPFADLPEPVLDALPARFTIRYVRRGHVLLTAQDTVTQLYVVRSGALDVHDAAGGLVDRVDVGESVGANGLLQPPPYGFVVTAVEDTLVLALPASTFHHLTATQASFASSFLLQQARRLHHAVETVEVLQGGAAVLKTRLRDLIGGEPVVVAPDCTIRDAARTMRSARVSSLLVVDGSLVGIVTDRDLRNRVLAEGRDPDIPIAQIMTLEPLTAQADSIAFELLLEMVSRNIHHMPVLDGDRLVGLVTSTDLIRLERASPLYVAEDAARQEHPEGLADVTARLPGLVEQLVAQDASADDIGRVVTAVGDAVERRLLDLVEAHLGPPPVPYCWVVLGSQARHEQGLSSDQDNALILADDATREHDAYFAKLATLMRDGLTRCGYPPCPGDVMATNPRWRRTLSAWRRRFATWIDEPSPEAVLHARVFFDMRPLHGDLQLCATLREAVLGATPGGRSFLAHLAKEALTHVPPLGVFRGLVLEKEGEHKSTLDLKRRGVGPVVDLARVAALSVGLPQVNTAARITAASDAGAMSAQAAADLREAFEFIASVRLRHQARQVRTGHPPDNYVPPAELSSFERRHLRDAFGVVRDAQSVLAARHPLAYIS